MELTTSLWLFTALLVLVGLIRLAELVLSRRNRRLMRGQGMNAVTEPHFRAMVLLHIFILVGAGVEAWVTRRAPVPLLTWTMLALLLAASALRWWVIASLGPHWNVAIMDSISDMKGGSPKFVAVSRGPFRWIRHPNYLAVFLELLALPLVHAAWLSALVGSAVHLWVLRHRVLAEEAVLLGHPSYQSQMAAKPRFIPRFPVTAVTQAWACVRLGRPLFLIGGFIFYGLGAAVAVAQGRQVKASVYLLGQAVVTAFHLMTHYANDYFDFEADRANATPTRWSGGSRVLTRGEVPRRGALLLALVAAALGVVATMVLASRQPGPWLLPLALAMLVLSWFYSAPPLRLLSTGLGELDVVLVVTALVPCFAFYLQTADWVGVRTLLLAIVPPCCLQFAMLLAVGVPDAAGDSLVGKHTLVLRLGRLRAMRWHRVAVAAAFLGLPVLVMAGLPRTVAFAAALPAPLALWRLWSVRGDRALRPEAWEGFTFWSIVLLVVTVVAELTGFLSL